MGGPRPARAPLPGPHVSGPGPGGEGGGCRRAFRRRFRRDVPSHESVHRVQVTLSESTVTVTAAAAAASRVRRSSSCGGSHSP